MKNLKGLMGFGGLGLGTKMVTLMGKSWDKRGRPPIKIITADEHGRYVIRIPHKRVKPEKILILQDPDMSLVRSLINKRDGVEAPNLAVWVTGETVEKFEGYSKAKGNFRAENSTGNLIDLYQRDLKELAKDPEVNEHEYARVYIPFPEVATDADKTKKLQEETSDEEVTSAAGVFEEKSEELTAVSVFVDVSEATKVHEKVEGSAAICDEEGVDKQTEEDPIKKKNEDHLEDLLHNSAELIKKGGIIKVLMFPRLPYSSWNINKIAEKCGLKLDSTQQYDSEMFKGFSPRKAGSDEKFSPNGSVIHTYTRAPGWAFCLIFEDAMGVVDVLKFYLMF